MLAPACDVCKQRGTIHPYDLMQAGLWGPIRTCYHCLSGAQWKQRLADVKGRGQDVPELPLTTQTVGLEMEFIGADFEVSSALRNANIPVRVEHYNHKTRRHWKIVPDSSVRYGAELVSPVLIPARDMPTVQTVCAAIQPPVATVNTSTGLHVHVGVKSNREVGFLARSLYAYYQPTITALLSPYRADNAMCRQEGFSGLESEGYEGERYRAVNLWSLQTYGTIEYRQHHGTLSSRHIGAWARLVTAITREAMRLAECAHDLRYWESARSGVSGADANSVAWLCADMRLGPQDLAYWQGRLDYWADYR